ncbi:glycyl-radical enzyme activating protein [Terrisporobacter mayombei]|nr:glycyl-radical enzyme activating protein [Terrisporobacter mayombei]
MSVAVVKKGIVLRIERASIHDGEGLRTVVFLKGCPLRCKWCSTPESQEKKIEYGYGKDMTVYEVVSEVCKDEVFFFHSGGGLTISGGEVLLQADFAKEILMECQKHGINTAIETSFFSQYSEIEKLLPYLNDIYVDFKLADEKSHIFYTGVSNSKIKENLLRLNKNFNGGIHIRIPVIPTVNFNKKDMEEIAIFLGKLENIVEVELLPYHTLGIDTYKKLGKEYELKNIKALEESKLKSTAEIFKKTIVNNAVKIKGKHMDEI